jgi:hypothetical protein
MMLNGSIAKIVVIVTNDLKQKYLDIKLAGYREMKIAIFVKVVIGMIRINLMR